MPNNVFDLPSLIHNTYIRFSVRHDSRQIVIKNWGNNFRLHSHFVSPGHDLIWITCYFKTFSSFLESNNGYICQTFLIRRLDKSSHQISSPKCVLISRFCKYWEIPEVIRDWHLYLLSLKSSDWQVRQGCWVYYDICVLHCAYLYVLYKVKPCRWNLRSLASWKWQK